jgi:prepilin-type processing-associated H-X9-DG protein
MYETTYPGASGYSLNDVIPFRSPGATKQLTCPLDTHSETAATHTTYMLLRSLEPFTDLKRAAEIPIVFDLIPHDLTDRHSVNILFADGHVEPREIDEARQLIEKTLANPPGHRQPRRPTASTQPVTQ